MSFNRLSEHAKKILGIKRMPDIACPACFTERNEDNCKIIREEISKLAKSQSRWFDLFYKGDQEIAFDLLARGRYGWACDSCLSSGAATLADFTKQNYCDWPPYLAYVDESLICRTCGSEFTFSKEEQLYWYETLGFLVQSRAVDCKSCRKLLRESKEEYSKAQKEAQKLKASVDLENAEQVSELISLYECTGSHRQISYYSAVLKQLKKKMGENDKE